MESQNMCSFVWQVFMWSLIKTIMVPIRAQYTEIAHEGNAQRGKQILYNARWAGLGQRSRAGCGSPELALDPVWRAQLGLPGERTSDICSYQPGRGEMLGKTEGRRRREWQKTGWLDGITDSMDMSLNPNLDSARFEIPCSVAQNPHAELTVCHPK